MHYVDGFFGGILVGIIAFISLIFFLPQGPTYEQGVQDTHKEAYKHGLMVKEISKDDAVIYRWIETHKLGYE
jgi:hypothetical protein